MVKHWMTIALINSNGHEFACRILAFFPPLFSSLRVSLQCREKNKLQTDEDVGNKTRCKNVSLNKSIGKEIVYINGAVPTDKLQNYFIILTVQMKHFNWNFHKCFGISEDLASLAREKMPEPLNVA